MEITVSGLRLNYEEVGRGRTAVFLHGWGGSAASLRGLAARLAPKYRTVLLDFPGFGASDVPPEDFGIYDYARVTAEFLARILRAGGKAAVIGHSFGGRVALILGARYPELTDKIVLIDGAGIRPRRGIIKRFRAWKYRAAKFLVRLKVLLPEKLEGYGSADYRALSPGMRRVFVRVVNQHLESEARAVKADTLILWGGRDRDTPPYMAKKLNKLIRGSRLHVFPDAGHYSYLDERDLSFLYIAEHLGADTRQA